MDKCPKCGHESKKDYCQCRRLTMFDLEPINGKEYCKRCEKEVESIKATLSLNRF